MMLGLVTLKVLREAMRTLRDHPYRYARERRSRTVRAGGGSGCAVLGSFERWKCFRAAGARVAA